MTTIACSGHQKLPEQVQKYVESRLDMALQREKDHLVGVCSLAAGADQLFAQAILNVGGKLHVIVPSQGYAETFEGAQAREAYESLLNRADSVDVLDYSEPSEDAYLEAGRRAVEMSNILIAIWDGEPARGKGGTADIVEIARKLGRRVMVLWPQGVNR